MAVVHPLAEEMIVSIPLSAPDVLNREFLELRAKILELAASLDRLERAAGDVGDDARIGKLTQAIELLLSSDPHRAERVQLLFSRPYSGDWQSTYKLDNGRAKNLPR